MPNLANALSFSRVPLAVGIAAAGWSHHWLTAFVLLIVAVSTDVLDGLAAKKFGGSLKGEFIDMICDLAMTVGALAGLVLGGAIGWMPIVIAAAIAVPVQVINSFFANTVLFRRFGVWFMPCYFLAVLWVMVREYLSRSGLPAWTGWLVGPVTFGLVYLKRDRFHAWFFGCTH